MAHIPLELIAEAARANGLEPAWLWLYLNGFKRRVPSDVRAKIEREVLRIDGEDTAGLRNAIALSQEVNGENQKEP